MSIVGRDYPLYYGGKNDEAMVWFRKALEVDPNFPVAYNDLSLVYGIQGDYDKMVESSLKAAALSGSSPERNFQVLFLKTFPPWRKLSGEKRYHELLHKMNLE